MAEENGQSNRQTVVLCLDASEQARNAMNWYIDHIHQPGNKMVFVHCIELPEPKLNQARSLHMSPGVLATMWKEQETKTKELEEKTKEFLKEKGLTGILRTATGKPGEVIVRIAEEEGAAMIVVGSRGMGKVRRTILGSVSDYLVHHANCPVVVCRYKQRRQSEDGTKSRHSSGSSLSNFRQRHFSGEKSRHKSGDSKVRHVSGDSSKAAPQRSFSTESESDSSRKDFTTPQEVDE